MARCMPIGPLLEAPIAFLLLIQVGLNCRVSPPSGFESAASCYDVTTCAIVIGITDLIPPPWLSGLCNDAVVIVTTFASQ